jgi:K+-sensing histidine kinase KdpD
MSEAMEPLAGPGRLRTYLGIAPGVGKTYAMLRDGRAQRRSGCDAVVAYWEQHGRAETVAQVADLELLPTRTVTYRGGQFFGTGRHRDPGPSPGPGTGGRAGPRERPR